MIDTAESVRQALSRPMPHADAATARLAAARAAGLSAELRRVQDVLSGAAVRQLGWSGVAEYAFQDALSAELGRFAPAIQRLEAHAAALTGYARELEVLGPQLLAARARLAGGPAGGVADFERCWQQWDAARRRCMAGLAVEGHRHGWWSGLTSEVSQTVRHEVAGLAGLSRVLGDLGQALTVAGLVLALVCPPAAGAVWAAVAVLAVCQLAVDVTRREHGEHVGLAGLGWDALAALPGGRLAAEAHSAAEASAAIERLAPELRSSRIVPGGGLKAHEGSATYRGHTLLKHYNKSPRQLTRRFKDQPDLTWSSSFFDRQTAESAIGRVLQERDPEIAQWLASPSGRLQLDADYGTEVGYSVSRDGVIRRPSTFRVVLFKEDSQLGYFIRTAYPRPIDE
ncbi:MAG TPA: RNase A-like domain-containing protein [Jatrophihabitans sp.]|nr:RNase A-like domain-containing protein [Jatrophihabitans sp.]